MIGFEKFSFIASIFLHVLILMLILINFNHNSKQFLDLNIINTTSIGLIDQTTLAKISNPYDVKLDSLKNIEEKPVQKKRFEELKLVEDLNTKKENNIESSQIDSKLDKSTEQIKDSPVKKIENNEDFIQNIAKEVESIASNNNDNKQSKIENISIENKIEDKKLSNIVDDKLNKNSNSNINKQVAKKNQTIQKPVNNKTNDKSIAKKLGGINSSQKKEISDLKKSLAKAQQAINAAQSGKSSNNKNTVTQSQIAGGEQNMAKLGSYIKTKIVSCWNIPPMLGINDIQKIYVIVRIKLDQAGVVKATEIINNNQYRNSEFFEKIKQSAIDAINLCSPIDGLPQEYYDQWKEIELTFDPNKMF